MRLLFLLPPLVLAVPFLACGGGSLVPVDAGPEATPEAGGAADVSDEIVFSVDSGTTSRCLLEDADPVGLCVQKAALQSLHTRAFHASTGATSSWSYATGAPDKGDGGLVTYSADDTVAYAAAAANYLASAAQYGDTTLTAVLTADLTAIASLIEANTLAPNTAAYSGEYYFHLRTAAVGLRSIGLSSDGNHFDGLADIYGRAIYSAHYFSLGVEAPDAAVEAGVREAGADGAHGEGGLVDGSREAAADASPHTDATLGDAGGPTRDAMSDVIRRPDAENHCPRVDAGASNADGVIGNPLGVGKVAYAPGDVATAAYALLDVAARNPTDCMVPEWLSAVRASLNHLAARAVEPSTGMYYRALVTSASSEGGASDALVQVDPSVPGDAVLADTQATFALAMIRAQYLVTSTTSEIDAGRDATFVDSGVVGPLVPVIDIPFEALADRAIAAMNGKHSLWDGPVSCPSGPGGVCKGTGPGSGYMDGYVPSTSAFIKTKSTRPNALMAGALFRAVRTNLNPYGWQLPTLVPLLIAQRSISVPAGSNLITVVPVQQAFFSTVSETFDLLDAGPDPESYTTGAVGAAVEGLTEQLFGRSQ